MKDADTAEKEPSYRLPRFRNSAASVFSFSSHYDVRMEFKWVADTPQSRSRRRALRACADCQRRKVSFYFSTNLPLPARAFHPAVCFSPLSFYIVTRVYTPTASNLQWRSEELSHVATRNAAAILSTRGLSQIRHKLSLEIISSVLLFIPTAISSQTEYHPLWASLGQRSLPF